MISTTSLINSSKKELVTILWRSDSTIHELLQRTEDLEDARELLIKYLCKLENHYFNVLPLQYKSVHHIIERNTAKECIRVFKNIICVESEQVTSFSALKILLNLAQNNEYDLSQITKGFVCEFIFLFRGINAKTEILSHADLEITVIDKDAAQQRSSHLDQYSNRMNSVFKNFRSGTDKEMLVNQEKNRIKILTYFNATEKQWNDYNWQLSNIIRDHETLSKLVPLSTEELTGLKEANKHNLPVQITPYYLTLFCDTSTKTYDQPIRAQVLPSSNYCTKVIENLSLGLDHDFMGEKSTSPIQDITRRYAQIVILKPFDSCPQICVYCQRNWEITEIENASVTDHLEKAIEWIEKNSSLTEVLVTGGDPLTLDDKQIDYIIGKLSTIKHLNRIRIGTRTIVTMPMRITPEFVKVIKKYHDWGTREISIMTHVEDSLELTPSVLRAVKLLKNAGINIYNQQVFTYYNSRRFQSCFLRKKLKLFGIDPYYLFNTKGKEETIDYRVPISRIEQERKEEARLLPGLERTDESVFNVPKIGKSHLRALQDHEPVMIMPNGQRVYRFYPWESKLVLADDYLYTDVSIYDYLVRLKNDGHDIDEYQSIWYYF